MLTVITVGLDMIHVLLRGATDSLFCGRGGEELYGEVPISGPPERDDYNRIYIWINLLLLYLLYTERRRE